MKKRLLSQGEDPDGVITFYCKPCGKFKRYKEQVIGSCEWLKCSCRCFCECHTNKRWNKNTDKCICKPCYPCGLVDEKSKTNPIASCGNRRLCHFGNKCNKNYDGMCSYKHNDDKDRGRKKLKWTP